MSTTEYVQIKELKPGMKNINAVFIVLEVGAPTLTKEAREVRTLRVADASACVNLSVWDEPGALLQPGDIVRLTRGYASLWRAALTLYSGKSGDIQKVGEFCMLFNEQLAMGGHEHGPPYTVPHYSKFQIKGIPELEELEQALAKKGLKDPWIRNEAWRYHPGFGTKWQRARKAFFRGLPLGLALTVATVGLSKLAGGDDHHGHGHEGDHH